MPGDSLGKRVVRKAKRIAGLPDDGPNSNDFWVGLDTYVPTDPENPLERYFLENRGAAIDKWHHYLPLYHRYMQRFRGTGLRFLEIGVQNGGSTRMWRQYFGEEAVLFGVDIDPRCAKLDGICASIRIGSQGDAGFLRSVVDEMGGVDIVLDDGSHDSVHMRQSLETLFPLLSDGGLYVIEDVHCSYWPAFSGGYRQPGSIVERTKEIVDDLHHWYHRRRPRIAATAGKVTGVHYHDSMIVLEKDRVERPRRSVSGERVL